MQIKIYRPTPMFISKFPQVRLGIGMVRALQKHPDISSSNYVLEYDTLTTAKTLDEIFSICQNDNPGRHLPLPSGSLSTGDVVWVQGNDKLAQGYYFCDIVGWVTLSNFERS